MSKKTRKQNILKKIVKKNTINFIEGIYKSINRNYGIVIVSNEKYEEEIFISSRNNIGANTGDKVLVKILKDSFKDKRKEGQIFKILERESDTIVGVIDIRKDFAFVVPLSKKIDFDVHIEKKYINNAPNGNIVEVKLLDNNLKRRNNPEGVVINVLGKEDSIEANIYAIIKENKIRDEYEDCVLEEINNLPKDLNDNEKKDRKDLRNIITFTIDGLDAKDLDDAVSLEYLDNELKKIYISIADVSYYVKENTFIDKEARKRGNSVYLLNKVIPMLPKELSNGLCSLNEDEDRLAKTVECVVDKNGNILSYDIYESIINVNKRMSYDGVHYILTGEDNRSEDNKIEDYDTYKPYKNILEGMYELSKILRKKREKNGSIDFDLKETYISLDDKMQPIDIKPYERYESHKLIEDFMLLANEVVAKEFYNKDIPFIYRIHEECDEEKIKNLKEVLMHFGIQFDYKNKITSIDVQKLLNKVKNKDNEALVSKLMLRSMQQAKYSTNCEGHFALALKYYTHFTSPIRRYSDLTIHRIIGEYLHKNLNEKRIKHYEKILEDIATSTSVCERKAIDCERNVNDYMTCLYMKDKIGEVYDGIVSGMTSFKIFVELDNTIEGAVDVRDLEDDYYIFDENNMEMYGQDSNKVYVFGQKVRVKLINVSVENRNIDFEMV